MAQYQLKFGQYLDKELAKGTSYEDAFYIAEQKSRLGNIEVPTPKQAKVIEARLRVKYPQMFEEGWTGKLKKKVKAELHPEEAKKTQATKDIERGLGEHGITEKETERMLPKELRKKK